MRAPDQVITLGPSMFFRRWTALGGAARGMKPILTCSPFFMAKCDIHTQQSYYIMAPEAMAAPSSSQK
jgi:hypothetical protein